MKNQVKVILLAVLYIAVMYAILIFMRPLFIALFIQKYSNIVYIDDVTLNVQSGAHMVLLVYSIVSFTWNRKTLKLIEKQSRFFWIANWFLDLFFIPLSVLIMVIYYNQKSASVNLSRIENMFLMALLLSIKHFLLMLIYRKELLTRKP